jgi:hypothetical protein
MTRSTMPLAVRWRNVKENRRRCLHDYLADFLYLTLRLL